MHRLGSRDGYHYRIHWSRLVMQQDDLRRHLRSPAYRSGKLGSIAMFLIEQASSILQATSSFYKVCAASDLAARRHVTSSSKVCSEIAVPSDPAIQIP